MVLAATLRKRWPSFKVLANPWLIQLALVELAVVTAFFLRFEFTIPGPMKLPLLWAVCVWAIVKITVSRTFGLHLLLWRYFSIPDLKRLA